ncbi:hypothetical protein ZIOFF_068185 [Zingiber officinale]|uniref:L-arabinokinase n=1 Tax=Zingiber officinale TaxID=94328 RepID=A0A8J5ET67_ZINOF|nr:hypothetical protein ZIOFF_068185 [Zingiber officinale]
MRIEGSGSRLSPSREYFVFAYYVTGHGFGHATRVVEVVQHLVAAGHDVHVVTGAPDFVFTSNIQSPKLHIRKVLLDCGAVQADALTVDRLASLEMYHQTIVVPRDSILTTEVEWLKSINADLVLMVAHTRRGSRLEDGGRRCGSPTHNSTPVETNSQQPGGYGSVTTTLIQQSNSRHGRHCEALGWRGVIRTRNTETRMLSFRQALGVNSGGKATLDSGSDVSIGHSPGSSLLLAEGSVGGLGGARKVVMMKGKEARPTVGSRAIDMNGRWVSDVVPIACRAAANAGIRSVCVTNFRLSRRLIEGVGPYSAKELSKIRLTENMHNVMGLELEEQAFGVARLHLWHNSEGGSRYDPEIHMAIDKADKFCFLRTEEIYVARAPGRLDVMGGIADYSGSLVLQMPIKEACHVAVQKNHPSKQKLWKHAQARQQAKGLGSIAVLQIVSFGSELSNRAPTFDIDLSDLMDGEQPMSYEKARQLFSQDPSQKWAAYAAGTVLVLMAELGVRFTQSISILVSSAVPEGKGVSSSAAVEVATMCAIAAAHDLRIEPRDIALLCQKVENHVVGAPCGVMDQMTSACGEANKLLAMVCQPAEVKELVPIPSHIRFWGLDSGIRHSVGGTDYGSVRIGAFMGRRMIKSEASSLLSDSLGGIEPQQVGKMTPDDSDEGHGIEILKTEALLDYLCNISTHRYECLYTKKLPERISGEEFLTKYLDHNDVVTIIDPKRTYAIKAPTKHPIYENFRVEAFKALLTAAQTDEQLCSLGELMYQCHYSYNECGLGSDGTDRLVNLVQEMQHSKSYQDGSASLFGAKITGGGSGGSVCVIGRNCIQSTEEIQKIQQRYKSATGYLPYVFEGSSPGAGKFGYLRIRMRQSLPDASPRN